MPPGLVVVGRVVVGVWDGVPASGVEGGEGGGYGVVVVRGVVDGSVGATAHALCFTSARIF